MCFTISRIYAEYSEESLLEDLYMYLSTWNTSTEAQNTIFPKLLGGGSRGDLIPWQLLR